MENSVSSQKPVKSWIAVFSAILSGWNIGLIVAFLILIGLSVGLQQFDVSVVLGDVLSIILISISTITGIIIGAITGKKLLSWFKKRKQIEGYIWLGILILITIFSFPSKFYFTV